MKERKSDDYFDHKKYSCTTILQQLGMPRTSYLQLILCYTFIFLIFSPVWNCLTSICYIVILTLVLLAAPFHGFAFWFDVEFSGPAILPTSNNQSESLPGDTVSSDISSPGSIHRRKRQKTNGPLVLSTAPENPPTHWQQVCIFITFCIYQMMKPSSCWTQLSHINYASFFFFFLYICVPDNRACGGSTKSSVLADLDLLLRSNRGEAGSSY